MKGDTKYDAALSLLESLLPGQRLVKDGQRAKNVARARELIAERRKYLETHHRVAFYFASSRGAKDFTIREYPLEHPKDFLDSDISEWAQEIANQLPPSGCRYFAGYRFLEDGEEVRYGDFDYEYVEGLPFP